MEDGIRAIYLYGARLPAPMWARPRTVRAGVLNAGVALALFASAWVGYDAVRFGDAFTPPAVVAVSYLLLVGRAAVCAESQSGGRLSIQRSQQ
jgi:hypothetical protein